MSAINALSACRVCSSTKLESAIDLGKQPWGNHFLKSEELGLEPQYPLHVVWCSRCKTAQLDFTVPKEVMFANHTYLSGITGSLAAHFNRLASYVDAEFFPGQTKKSVLDIGSNDGTQLKQFKSLGWTVLGVESSETTANIANLDGIETLQTFYNEATQNQISRQFDVINASGVFFHLEELHSVTKAIKAGLKTDGIFVVQFLYMKSIMENAAFDQIYHEHLLYYTLSSLNYLLGLHDLEVFDAYLDPIHGGSIMAFVGHPGKRRRSERLLRMRDAEELGQINELKAYKKLESRMRDFRDQNLDRLSSWQLKGKRVFGLGAPVKGNTLLNYLGVDRRQIQVLVEKNPLRRGLFAPGSHIPVVVEDEFKEVPDIYYVLAWNFKKEILKRYQSLIESGVHFYFPIDSEA